MIETHTGSRPVSLESHQLISGLGEFVQEIPGCLSSGFPIAGSRAIPCLALSNPSLTLLSHQAADASAGTEPVKTLCSILFFKSDLNWLSCNVQLCLSWVGLSSALHE